MSGTDAATFVSNVNNSLVFESSVSTILNLDSADSVIITDVTTVVNGKRRMSITSSLSSVNIAYEIHSAMQDMGYQNADDAVAYLRSTLESSISGPDATLMDVLKTTSKSYGVQLYDSIELKNVTLIGVSVAYNSKHPTLNPTPFPSLAPSSSPTSVFAATSASSKIFTDNMLFILVIVLGSLAICFVLAVLYFCFKKYRSHQLNESHYGDIAKRYIQDNNSALAISELKTNVKDVELSIYRESDHGIVLGSDIPGVSYGKGAEFYNLEFNNGKADDVRYDTSLKKYEYDETGTAL
jgi:hypothetical protein